MSFPLFRLCAAILALAPAAVLRAEPAIIAKARACLGSEAALNAVKSIHYTGRMTAGDPAKPVTGTIDIIFETPYRQRTLRTSDSVTDTVALDTYDGWHRVQDSKDPTRWRVQILPTDQVKRQRATVLENLSFFRGLERAGVRVLDEGSTTVNGVACRKIAFVHEADVIFYRYFDEASGRLVLSETEGGNTIREQGEILVNGIKFPRVIINSSKSTGGKEETVTVTFDSITLNESFPDSIFAFPSFSEK